MPKTCWFILCANVLILTIGITRWPTEQLTNQKKYVKLYTKSMACLSVVVLATTIASIPVLTSNKLEASAFLVQLYLLRVVQRFFNGKRLIGFDFSRRCSKVRSRSFSDFESSGNFRKYSLSSTRNSFPENNFVKN